MQWHRNKGKRVVGRVGDHEKGHKLELLTRLIVIYSCSDCKTFLHLIQRFEHIADSVIVTILLGFGSIDCSMQQLC